VTRAARRSGAARAALAASAAALLAGCAVGPRYARPAVAVPAAYAEESAEGTRSWKPAEPADTASRGPWWEVFGDPDLDALQKEAAAANQTVAQAEANFRAARAVARGARADLFPTVSAGVSATRSRTAANRSTAIPGAPAGTGTTYEVSGDFGYEIDVWGRVRRNLEANVASAQAAAADLEAVRLSVHAELAVDYFALRGIDAQRDLLSSNIAAFEKALKLTRDRHAQGVVSGVDVAQAETQLETTRAQAVDIGVARAGVEHAIAVLVGVPASSFALAPASLGDTPPSVPAGLPSELLERRPDVAAAERRVASANADVGITKSAFYPILSLTGTGGFESTSLTNWITSFSSFWSIGPSALITVFDGGRRRAAADEARAAYDEASATYQQAVLVAFQEVEDQLATLRVLSQEATVQQRAVDAAERSLEQANLRYRGGLASYLEVVVAQSVALQNERAAVDVLTRRMTASVLLIKGLGGGWNVASLPRIAEQH
jgi:NodT family efflux transporter outer membrane factor (OMF) lipoprotein